MFGNLYVLFGKLNICSVTFQIMFGNIKASCSVTFQIMFGNFESTVFVFFPLRIQRQISKKCYRTLLLRGLTQREWRLFWWKFNHVFLEVCRTTCSEQIFHFFAPSSKYRILRFASKFTIDKISCKCKIARMAIWSKKIKNLL